VGPDRRMLVEDASEEILWAQGLISDEVPDCPLRAGTCGGVWCVLCVNFVGKLCWELGN
jgi:hypothetical protein